MGPLQLLVSLTTSGDKCGIIRRFCCFTLSCSVHTGVITHYADRLHPIANLDGKNKIIKSLIKIQTIRLFGLEGTFKGA